MIFQGDRTEKVGVIDSEYVVHQGIPSLGGPSLSSKVLHTTNCFFNIIIFLFLRNLVESSRNQGQCTDSCQSIHFASLCFPFTLVGMYLRDSTVSVMIVQ